MRPVTSDYRTAKKGGHHVPFSPEIGALDMDTHHDMAETGHLTLSMDLANHRFVAGDKFFNYQQYGALRGGGEVTLFSRDYAGVLVAAAQSSFTYAIMRYCVRPTLMNFLALNRPENQAVIECLISLPTSFSLFCGLASDVLPIASYRRKSYILLGIGISFIMLLGLTVLAGTINPTTTDKEGRGEYLIYYMLLILGSVAGTLVSKVATDARVIELSQREPLTSRGHIQINYLIFRSLFECFASWSTSFVVDYDKNLRNYHLKFDMFWVLLALTVIALVPIPFVLMNCKEKSVQQSESDLMNNMLVAGMPMVTPQKPMNTPTMRVRAFFRMCQQRAVWQIVLFLSILLSTTRFFFGSANKALKSLASLNADTSLRTDAIKFMVTIAVMIGWKAWWSNSDWRRTMYAGLFALVSVEVFRALLMLYVPGSRTQLFYDAMLCIMAISDGVITIFSFIPATEIAEYGSEGATIGLLQSFRSCLAVATRTISDQAMSKVASVELKQGDATGTLCLLLMISYGVHALAFFSVLLLPRQKLDAQQLRVYGGYSKIACGVLIVIFMGFFSFSTTINLKAMVDMALGTDTA